MELRRTELLAKPPRRAARPTAKTRPERSPALMHMQRAAGNAAVASLVGQLVQRDPDTTGWTGKDVDTRGPGWNAKAREVGATKIERIPVEGIKLGNQDDGESSKTTESAKGRAIVLLPVGLKPNLPVDVMLHLHGFGYRAEDPYAGWRQDKGSQTVRDVDQDRIEEQMKAAADRDADVAQTIVILAQGVGGSKFGNMPYNKYAEEVLGAAAKKGFPQLPGVPAKFKLTLSAHSGGGDRIVNSIDVDPGKHTIKEPDNLAEIVLMDALHGNAAETVGAWAEEHMRRVREATSAADQADELAKCPTLRAFHSDEHGYPAAYAALAKLLKKSHDKNPAGLKAVLLAKFPYPVHLEGSKHETVVRGLGDDPAAGPLADALGAIHHPDNPSKVLDKGKPTWTGLPPPVKATPPAKAGAVQRQPTETKAKAPKKSGPAIPAGAIPSSRLGELGTPEETKFRRDVYDTQFRRTLANPDKIFTVGLTAKEIGGGKVDGKPIHKDVAADAQSLVDAARAARDTAAADDKAADHKLAKKCTAIGVDNAYRGIEDDFTAWVSTYTNALGRTKEGREALGEGKLYSGEALELMVADLLGAKASPGFSNHSKGLAMDLTTTQGGATLGPHKSQRTAWTKTWLHPWLVANAATYHFNPLSTEEWHWDHDAVAPAPTGDAETHGDAPAPAVKKDEPPKPAAPAAVAPVQRAPGDPPPLEITWGAHARADVVAANSLTILGDVLRAAGLHKAEITSTARTAEDQARAMYQNHVGSGKGQGVAAQHDLYGPAGDAVIDVFVDLKAKGKNATEIKAGMEAKIQEIGPSKVSNHCADPTKLNVFDVGPASLGGDTAQKAFVKAAQDEEGKRISKFIPYPKDPGDHFEIVPS